MLISRISKWGLEKKLKKQEVKAIRQEKRERDRAGKKSIFFLRGYPVDMGAVEQHIQRSNMTLQVDHDTRWPHQPMPRLLCITPPDHPSLLDFDTEHSISSAIRESMEWAESSSSGLVRDKVLWTPLVRYFMDAVDVFCYQSYKGDVEGAFQALRAGSDTIQSLVEHTHHSTIPSIFYSLLSLQRRGHGKAWSITGRQFGLMSVELLGRGHPRSGVFYTFFVSDLMRYEDKMTTVLQAFITCFEAVYGPDHILTHWYKLQAVAWGLPSVYRVSSRHDTLEMLSQLDREYGTGHVRTLTVLFYSAEHMSRLNKPEDAEILGLELLGRSHDLLEPRSTFWRCRAFFLVGEAQFHEKRYSSAMKNLQTALNLHRQLETLRMAELLHVLDYLQTIADATGHTDVGDMWRQQEKDAIVNYLTKGEPRDLGMLDAEERMMLDL